jgi:hypothetical protein
MLTNSVYKSNKFSVELRENDYRYVKSNKTIKKGELLLIEHCYLSKTADIIQTLIINYHELFDNLFPRNKKWTEKILLKEGQTEEIMNLVYEKAQKNMFRCGENKYSIALEASNFNHSTTPNAYVKNLTYNIDENVSVFIVYIISSEEININEEITVSYGNAYFGDNADIINYSNVITDGDVLVHKIMSNYIHEKKCLEIIINHIGIFHGLYILGDDLVCPSKRFMKTLNKEPTLVNILQWIYEKKIYYNKLVNLGS